MLLTLPRIVLAGVSSGVGKTTITTAFIANIRTRGIAIQPFKVGPDYIDPSHLALAAARLCYNLDTWMMPPSRMLDVFCRAAASAEIAVIEGMMGLYDGERSTSDVGSTAEVAKILRAPVVLVIDASAMATSGTPGQSECALLLEQLGLSLVSSPAVNPFNIGGNARDDPTGVSSS